MVSDTTTERTQPSFGEYFRKNIRDDSAVILHNADMYPPSYESIHVVSYRRTTEPVTVSARLLPRDQATWSHRTAYSMMTSLPGAGWLREHAVDPIVYGDNPNDPRDPDRTSATTSP